MKPVLLAVLLMGVAAPAWAQMPSDPPVGFPGDGGRPLGGGLKPPPPHGVRPPPPPLPAGPTIDLALEAARAAVAACAKFHVSVSVIDAEANPKLYYVPDGTPGWHVYMGFRKAYTALKFHRPNEEVAAMAASDPAVAAQVAGDANMVVWAGGVPLMAGGRMVGAIGVSGAEPSSQDEACAKAGIAAIADRLQ